MDGFDDLLAPSRSVLEENPFSDPFGKRSGSPDPWASPFVQQHDSVFHSGFGSHEPTSPTDEPAHDEEVMVATPVSPTTSVDPLDSAAANEPEEEEEHKSPPTSPSPGFRESVEAAATETEPSRTNFSETATIRPTEPEELEPTIPVPEEPAPRQDDTALPSHTKSISQSGPALSHSEPAWGPLEQTGNVDRAFSSLSLGGETLGGWRGEQENWSNDRPASRFPTEQDDDSDDDKPIGTLRSPERGGLTSPRTQHEPKADQPMFDISVDDPQKVGDPIRSFTMYTVHTRTTVSSIPKSHPFPVLRRYSDFLWLYEQLSLNNPGVVVPPVPEKNTFGRFDDQFVRQRRFALEKCIQKIANHPILGKDTDLKMFLESDSFALDIKHRKAQSGGLMATIGHSLTGPRFSETDEWFDKQKGYLDSLESQLRGLAKAIEAVAKQRAEISVATGEFAQTVADLSSSDIGSHLAQSLAGLADVERKAQDNQVAQSEQDMATLMATVDEYARLINSVRLAFSSRIRTYHAWRNAEGEAVRVKQTHERNRAQGRVPSDRAGYGLSQIADAERKALEAKHEFESVSRLVKSEVARFEQERIEDIKDSLNAFLEGMIARQKQMINHWENYQQMLLKKVGAGRGANP
ncbi:Vps5 C terminal like-domain-containing protein [Desarmillaria tabescens]|uniref:Vps5 C terminal like-domain-containing protein n=1 Tax=Armillaria tabescens TaxID=1929756 RepID=A0AA39NK39_ARMTA|nr:Vps5 C terminal like-domain-containing protein [Desarmillaria tabescens]KAK0467060.1 Vps5 C terminal like-domain-containing protein [Desarmillaria tabescens]